MNPVLELDTPMTRQEWRASLSLAAIYMLRMLGMFLILPVFAVLARDLPGATPVLVGLAISAYGLTQAIFQIPFGLWSDRYGRKPLITLGLLLFVIGSAVAALSDSIYGIILGRSLQGAGAVAAVVMALAADLTREEHRTKAMALIGISIGLSFAISMVAGPVLSNWMGLKGLFWLITALAALSIVVLHTVVPDPIVSKFHRDAQVRAGSFARVFANPELLRLDFGIFCLHLILTASFVVIPLVLKDDLQLPARDHWHLYLPVFVLAIVSMVPFVILAEEKTPDEAGVSRFYRLDRPFRPRFSLAGKQLLGHVRPAVRILHGFQSSGGDTPFHGLQNRAAGPQGHGHGRLLNGSVSRYLCRRRGRGVDTRALRHRRRVRVLRGGGLVLARLRRFNGAAPISQ